ncbi:release factor glutamine methyltransferase [Lachnospiraceae bacterium NK3A20]|nr:release factor glutamine methyltransferase [Lachnospiraceae bacterium NK3A20]
MITYGQLYEEGRRILGEMPEGDLDARLLLEEVCGTTLQTLLVYPDQSISEEKADEYRTLLARRRGREPLSVILGHADFMGLTFRVTRDVLKPEQDTEILVEEAIRRIEDPAFLKKQQAGLKPLRILDLCTGSGCIILSVLHYLMEDKKLAIAGIDRIDTVACDLSEKALAIAAENAENLGWKRSGEVFMNGNVRLMFSQGDLFQAVPRGTFQAILSNPPYIPDAVIDTLEPEVKFGEPYMALSGGEDGLTFYRRIAQEVPAYLAPGGFLLTEIGYDQGESVPELYAEAGLSNISVMKDYGGNNRVVAAELR